MAEVLAIEDDLALLGTAEAPRAKERLLDRGAAALAQLLVTLASDADAAGASANDKGSKSDKDANPLRGRWLEIADDLTDVLVAFAYDYPEDFAEQLAATPTVCRVMPLVTAAPQLPAPLREKVLLAAVESPSGEVRWEALTALLADGHPEIVKRLNDFLWDGHELVVFAAVRGAREHGDNRALPRLVALAEAPDTPVGARHHAWEAIEAIGEREGCVDLPRRPPPPSIRLPAAVPIFRAWGKATVTSILVSEGDPVRRGQDVAEVSCFENAIVVPAPCDGVVVEVALQEGDECANEQAVVWVEGPLLW
jgi:hypothetical protein